MPRFLLLVLIVFTCQYGVAQDEKPESPPPTVSGPVPLNPEKTVLLDTKERKLILKTTTCLRQGVLEMFLCPKQTKEHESIVSIDAKMAVIHAGLLALGAKPGAPAQFQPEFKPPMGQKIRIVMSWKDKDGKEHSHTAQQLIRNVTYRYFEEPLESVPAGVVISDEEDCLRYDEMNRLLLWFGHMTTAKRDELLKMSDDKSYQKVIRKMFQDSQFHELNADFVFVGSKIVQTDEGESLYLAEMGSGICVANFSDSMIDINIKSSASDAVRLYEPYTERLPETGTPATVELLPVFEKQQEMSSHFRSVPSKRLHNLFQIGTALYSGSRPEIAQDYEELRRLGIRTIVSVDGAVPQVEMARESGIRTVHLPLGYDGVSHQAQAALAQVIKTCESPIYIHCHHGKHRGPAAAAICGILTEAINRTESLQFLSAAGTSQDYAGLWQSVKDFNPQQKWEPVELKESIPPVGLNARMVTLEKRYQRLKQESNSLKSSERDRLVSLLQQDFKEAARLELADQELSRQLEETSNLIQILKTNAANRFEVVEKNCQACHAEKRH